VRCRLRQQFRSGVAEAALIEDEKIEAGGEVRCDQSELLAQRSLGQTQRSSDSEPVALAIEEHERAVVTTAGEVEAGNKHDRIRRLSSDGPVGGRDWGTISRRQERQRSIKVLHKK
jgi:hypothetical protein